MSIPSSIQHFSFTNTQVSAYIPSPEWLQQQFDKKDDGNAPYWAQVWPAAKALCEVIAARPALVKDKTVLELAAGLGLPSLLAAQVATEVTATDYVQEAVNMIKQSVILNNLNNVTCSEMNWNNLDKKVKTDVLLLSDINYDPKAFDTLYTVLHHFIHAGTTVILSTPQRLMAKPFMERLLPFKKEEYEMEVKNNHERIPASVWVLRH